MTDARIDLLIYMLGKKGQWIGIEEITKSGHSQEDFHYLKQRHWFDAYRDDTYMLKSNRVEQVDQFIEARNKGFVSQPWIRDVVVAVVGGLITAGVIALIALFS